MGMNLQQRRRDLENLANEAALTAARNHHDKVTMRDFELALDRIILGSERPPLVDEVERKVHFLPQTSERKIHGFVELDTVRETGQRVVASKMD